LNRTKNRTVLIIEHWSHACLTTLTKIAYLYAACAVHVTIFSTGGKFHPVLNFTQLHALTQVIHFYTLLFVLHNKNYIPRRNFCKFSHFTCN